MPERRYSVYEAFLTLQGEGTHAGRRAAFVRFSGCNVWSGREQDRERDSAKGCCAAWCDTTFNGTGGTFGGKYTAQELAALVLQLWGCEPHPLVVITGGEPSLQLDDHLVSALQEHSIRVHVETNGSHALPDLVDWVTLSPKPPMAVVYQRYDEVKVVFPAGINPLDYHAHASRRFVQPLDSPLCGKSNAEKCIQFVLSNPGWRLSLQTHKLLGLP